MFELKHDSNNIIFKNETAKEHETENGGKLLAPGFTFGVMKKTYKFLI